MLKFVSNLDQFFIMKYKLNFFKFKDQLIMDLMKLLIKFSNLK